MSKRPQVRVDGVVEIPAHKWYEFIDVFTRIDELLETISKQIDYTNRILRAIAVSMGVYIPSPETAQEEIMPTPIEVKAPLSVVSLALNNRYRVFKLDLSVERKDVPLGLRSIGVVANSATVVRMDSPAFWRRNDPVTGDLEELSVGYHIRDFAIEELYITNSPGTGYLTIVVEWRA
jgi:hypothetical protein